jgi:hypothetical protein
MSFATQITINTDNLPDIGFILTHHVFEILVVLGVLVLGVIASFALEFYKTRIQGKVEEAKLKKAVAKGLAGISTVLSAAGSLVALLQHGDLTLLNYVPAVAAAVPTIASVAYFFYNLGGNKYVQSTIQALNNWTKKSDTTVATPEVIAPTSDVSSDLAAPSAPESMLQ